MKYKDLRPGQHCLLEVSRIDRRPSGKGYFVFQFDDLPEGVRVGMFKYQEQMADQPGLKIECYVKADDNGQKVIVQDYAQVYKQLYCQGAVYDFVVKKDMTDATPPHYLVSDGNGFRLRLAANGKDRLYPNQRIKCRVEQMQNSFIRLNLVTDTEEDSRPAMLTLDALAALLNLDERQLQDARKLWAAFGRPLCEGCCKEAAEAYEAGHGEWIFLAIDAIDSHLTDILRERDAATFVNFLTLLRRVTLYLLEESDYISRLADAERQEKQHALSETVHHINRLADAYKLIQGKKGGDLEYIGRMLDNVARSGYLYEPERQLSILINLFRLKPRLADEKMDDLLGVIISRPLEQWKAEPFRSAFITLLLYFIDTLRPIADNVADLEERDDRQALNRIVKALAIFQLLSEPGDATDLSVYVAMLDRYLSFYNDSYRDALLDLSREAAAGRTGETGYKLEECAHPLMLALGISQAKTAPAGGQAEDATMHYTGTTLQLEASPTQLLLKPVTPPKAGKALRSALPAGLKLWGGIDVWATDSIRSADQPLTELRKQWLQVERSFEPDKRLKLPKQPRRIFLGKGDLVSVYVEGPEPGTAGTYRCRFTDPDYDAQYAARLAVNEIVRWTTPHDLTCFRDEQTGLPIVYRAEVINVQEDQQGRQIAALSLMKAVDELVEDGLDYEEPLDCRIMSDNVTTYTCLDAYGLTVILRKTADCPDRLLPGTMVCVRLLGRSGFRNQQAEYISLSGPEAQPVSQAVAFRHIMQELSEERLTAVPEEVEGTESEAVPEDTLLSEAAVAQLIRTIDRKTAEMEDYRLAFHHLYAARLMALMIEDKELTAYLDDRLKILLMMDNFAINQTIDLAELNRLAALPSKVAGRSVQKLRIITSLDDQRQNGNLWQNIYAPHYDNEHIATLSRLALAYNLLSEMGFAAQRRSIIQEIERLLHFKTYKTAESLGEENDTTEFKTSLISPPASHMEANPEVQTMTILKVICAFLNARGGRLYLGVNDYGIPTGLAQDLRYYLFHESKDAYVRYLHDNVRRTMHDAADSRIDTEWRTIDYKDVLIVTVQPSPGEITLDGQTYVRRGPSCRLLTGKDLDEWRAERTAQPAVGSTAESTAAGDAAGAETASTSAMASAAPQDEPAAINDKAADALIPFCLTGTQRNNVLHNFLEGYVEPIKYITLYPDGHYRRSDTDPWEMSGHLTGIAIHEEEQTGWLVMVYANGSALRVPMKDLLGPDGQLTYYNNSPLLFASPAMEGESLLLFYEDAAGNAYFRCEAVEGIPVGPMRAGGKPFTKLACRAVYADIVPTAKAEKYNWAASQALTKIGSALKHLSGTTEEKIDHVLAMAGLTRSGEVRE